MLKLNTNNTLKLIGKLFSFPKSELPHCTSIKQWGTFNSGRQPYPTDSSTFEFPITFSNSCYQTIVSTNDGGIYTASWTKSQLTIYVKNDRNVDKDNVYINTVRYWAIGI